MRGNLRQTSIPDASARSGLSSPAGPTSSLQLNRFTRLASVNLDKAKENPIPGQSLLPAPNGTNLESVPLKSKFEPKCLSGLYSSASSPHISGFRWSAQALIITCVSRRAFYIFTFYTSKKYMYSHIIFRG